MQLDIKILLEHRLQSSTQEERAAPPEDPVQVKGIVHVKVAELDGAVFL